LSHETNVPSIAEIAAIINNWQLALKSYRDDLRVHRTVVRAFDYMRLAQAHREHAEALLERLERQDMASRSAVAPVR
jgi:site-specific recombinase XerD